MKRASKFLLLSLQVVFLGNLFATTPDSPNTTAQQQAIQQGQTNFQKAAILQTTQLGGGETPANTSGVMAGSKEETKIAEINTQIGNIPEPTRTEVVNTIQEKSTNDEIDARTAQQIIDEAKLKMAREKLKALSQSPGSGSSGNALQSQGQSAKGGSSSGAKHGSSGGAFGSISSPSNFEAFQSRSPLIQKDIQSYSDSLATYTKTATGLLSDSSLAKIQNSFIDIARNTLNMPRGKEKPLSDNYLFQSLNDDTKDALKDSFLGLVKNSASDKAPSADLLYLKDIVTDTNFQLSAEKILGPENLSYLNVATIGADLLDVKAITGATYASFLNLTEGTIAGATASGNVTEWMQAADFLSSKTFLASTRDAEFASLMRKGFADLNETYKRLSALKALDFLDLLDSPKKVDMKKILDAGVISAIAALRQAKRLKSRAGWDSGMLSNFNYFQKHINATLKEAATLNSSEELLTLFDKTLSNNSFRAYWRSFDYPGYFKYRRSVASVYFSVKFKDFKEYKITPQTANDLIYAKTPKNYPKDNAMFFITAAAMEYVKAQNMRIKGLADQQKAEDKKYLVKQLASDKYYSNLEDEKN